MIKTAILTRASDGKTVLLQIQQTICGHTRTDFKGLTRYELAWLVSTGADMLAEDTPK